MKRFYCTVCKKVKRVQKIPIIIDSLVLAGKDINNYIQPDERLGICNKHSEKADKIRSKRVS